MHTGQVERLHAAIVAAVGNNQDTVIDAFRAICERHGVRDALDIPYVAAEREIARWQATHHTEQQP